MAACAGLAGRGTVAELRRCIGVAEPGTAYCTVHLRQLAWKHCNCGQWFNPTGRYPETRTCPNCGAYHPAFEAQGAPTITDFEDRNRR